jgi:hypothetical protein
VQIGGTTYKFVTALTGNANEVLIGASDTQGLLNLKSAVNATAGGAGNAYGVGTVANTNVNAGTATATTLAFTANVNGTGGNAITTTIVGGGSGHESWTAGAFAAASRLNFKIGKIRKNFSPQCQTPVPPPLGTFGGCKWSRTSRAMPMPPQAAIACASAALPIWR